MSRMRNAFETLLDAIDVLHEVDFDNPEEIVGELKKLMTTYLDRRDELEDKFYINKGVLWIIDMASAMSREKRTIAGVNQAVAKALDRAYAKIATRKIDRKYICDSFDRDLLEVALIEPTFKGKKDDKKDEGSSGLIAIGG